MPRRKPAETPQQTLPMEADVAELPLSVLAAALMLCGYGTTLGRRLRDGPSRTALIRDAAARATEAADALAARGLSVRRGPDATTPVLVVRQQRPGAHLPLPTSAVAVVGARATDPYGAAIATTLGRAFARAGLTVISGGAEGCDAAAHSGALEGARPGQNPTIAVIPGGLDAPYPSIHAPLFDRIVREGGTLVSADWPTARPARHTFVDRNRVIAALAGGVIVARAQLRSGSLSTVHAARRLDRPVGAVPGNVGALLSEGCHHILEEGGAAIASANAIDRFARAIGCEGGASSTARWPQHATPQPPPWAQRHETEESPHGSPAPDNTEASEIYRIIAGAPGIDLDSLADRTNLAAPTLAGVLLQLEVAGRVARGPGGRYMATE